MLNVIVYFPCAGHFFELIGLIFYFASLHLKLLLGVDGGQEILNDIVLPVLDGTVALHLLRLQIYILDVHPSVV